jgi:hypothetical protein
MSCVILTSKEIIYQTTEWVPVEMEAASKENNEKSKKSDPDLTPEEIPISPDERINPKTKKREKKFHHEEMSTFFKYDIPSNLKTTKLTDELDKLYCISEMISIFINMGFTLRYTESNSVHGTSIYTKYILMKTVTNNNNKKSYNNNNKQNYNNNRQ